MAHSAREHFPGAYYALGAREDEEKAGCLPWERQDTRKKRAAGDKEKGDRDVPACAKAQGLERAGDESPWPRNSPPRKVSQGSNCKLFLIAPNRKQAKCPARGERLKKFW